MHTLRMLARLPRFPRYSSWVFLELEAWTSGCIVGLRSKS